MSARPSIWRHPLQWWHAYYRDNAVKVGTWAVLIAVFLGFRWLGDQQNDTLVLVQRSLVAINQDIDDGDDRRDLLIEVQEAVARLEEIGRLQRCQFGIIALVALDARMETIENLPPEPCGLTADEIADLKALVLDAVPPEATTTTTTGG